MNKDFFKTTKILDGGMGQELLARGMEPKGTLWSANALIEEKYHDLILNIHNDFIKSGADVIVTTTFTTRRKRLRENGIEDQFKFLNQKACEIAQKAKLNNPNFYYSGNSTNPEAFSLAKLSNNNGFFSEYAKYSISEDMAETFSFINSREKYVSEVINLDKILNKKVIFIKEGMSNIEKSL